jgi:phage baseplate assembly protein W
VDLGKGVSFPIELKDGGLKWKEGLEHLRQSIFLILATRRGERVMRPWFGSRIHDYIDAPLNLKTMAQLRYEIWSAFDEETRARLKKIIIENPQPQWVYFTIILSLTNTITVAVRIAYNRDLRRWEVDKH